MVINKKILILSLINLALLIVIVPLTFSRFTSTVSGDAIGNIAFYVIDLKTQTADVKLEEISPQKEDYIYTFSVANYNDTKQLETNAEYHIAIRTTTNLNLDYKLYENDKEKDILVQKEIVTDDDGTYFNIMKTEKEKFTFKEKKKNEYKLLINFPEEYMGYDYQGIIESMEIMIISSQITE